ncbi:flagellar assembly protein FliW [Bacillus kwashiorkori]|uniref:flagellar assembly protein FliW n=1 Tax=Bacillus kwashiorkori TaxID=1522318 RepID=UPI000783D126|nr:flagellar assembly protein FliW [Bacillus kwashiorkori]
MKINTKYFGEIEIQESDIITFETGIPGFLMETEFVILPLSDDKVFHAMQSVKTAELAFVITNPFLFFQEYDFSLEDSVVEQLAIERVEEVQVYNILTVRDPLPDTTANLQAPIIINSKNNFAKQVILNNTEYQTRHHIFEKTPAQQKG